VGRSASACGDEQEWSAKLGALRQALSRHESLVVAYSGGVDSSVLLAAAREVLGARASAVIADSASLPRRELESALHFARSIGVEPVVARTEELSDERYAANAGDRCYWCKSALFEAMGAWAARSGVATMAFGEIVDDRSDHRPGARAALEFGVVAPLAEAGWTKADVRRYAAARGLVVADKPASACLSSRLPVGTRVTRERLARIEAAEEALKQAGLRVLRVRDHGASARVEVGAEELESCSARWSALEALVLGAGFASAELARYVPPGERGPSRP
jgi:uncharacterized protein